MASEGGETTSRLATAMAEAEVKMAAETAKPARERDIASIQAAYMKTLLGGDGDLTDGEKNQIMCREDTCKTNEIIDSVLSEPDSDHLNANETENLKRGQQDQSLIEISRSREVAISGNIFLSGLIGLTQFASAIVLTILGLVWWLAVIVGFAGYWSYAYFVGPVVSSIVCAMWWLLGQFTEFITWGALRFGDFNACMHTIWFKPVIHHGQDLMFNFAQSNPWNYIGDVHMKLGDVADRFPRH